MAKKKVKSKFSKTNQPGRSKITDKINEDVIAAALSAINAPVLIKMCRLCETKDGPFLNIFDSSTTTAKKLEDLMPFTIAESDDLPHKICFRCSAKVEELHEFVQKCIKTQNSLHEALGKKAPIAPKNKIRTKWEEKLNKSNISNDDICDALIKKAMEGIKNIPLNKATPLDDDDKPLKAKKPENSSDTATAKNAPKDEPKVNSDSEVALKHVRLSIEKCDKKLLTNTPNEKNCSENSKSSNTSKCSEDSTSNSKVCKQQDNQNTAVKNRVNDEKTENTDDKNSEEVNNDPPFNIMEYVTMIKVNSVGILFQCKLCNRNFLKKEVVETHGCAKTGIPKIDLTAKIPPPEPPKPPSTVKYIKIDGSTRRPVVNKDKESEDTKKDTVVPKEEESKSVKKPKPKIGPASKKRSLETNSETESQNESSVKSNTEAKSEISTPAPLVTFSANPNLNKLYKLVPGPNNTFQLIDGQALDIKDHSVETATPKAGNKRKYSDDENTAKSKTKKSDSKSKEKTSNMEEVIDLENDTETPATVEQPYPVGLFQTRSHISTTYPSTSTSEVPSFTTPAMKKQSYSVVRMENSSKLVISTKPVPPAENVPRKKVKKGKTEDNSNQNKEPYNVTIEEDVNPNKDPGFFTFINVDPLLQPSYVLPTSNIIQESQISTSTPAVKNKSETKDKYTCNMCDEQFSREKKLLAHIQSHYTQMDEEDKQREKSTIKKKGKKT